MGMQSYNQYPSLSKFIENMVSITNEYVEKALQGQQDGYYTLSPDELKSYWNEIYFDYCLFVEMLSDRPEFKSVDITTENVEIEIAPEYVINQESREEPSSLSFSI